MKDEIVMYDSDEAAKPHTLSGWLSRRGIFYADESTARYDGCTHRPCRDCGAATEKSYLICRDCRQKADLVRYEAREKKAWDGNAWLYSDAHDRYFESPGDAEEWADDNGFSMEDMRLLICEPNHVRQLEPDYCCDELADDSEGEVPGEVEAAMQAFNEAVKGIVLSWSPGKYALERP